MFDISSLCWTWNICMTSWQIRMIPQRVIIWLFLCDSAASCKCGTLSWSARPAGLWLVVLLFYSLITVIGEWGVYDPMHLGPDCSKQPSWNMSLDEVLPPVVESPVDSFVVRCNIHSVFWADQNIHIEGVTWLSGSQCRAGGQYSSWWTAATWPASGWLMLPWMETPTSCPRFTSLSQSPAMTFSFSFSDDCIPTKSRLNGFSSLTKGNIQGPMWRLCRHFFYGSCWRKGICYLILTYSTSSSASPELTPLPTKSTIGSYRPDHVLEFFLLDYTPLVGRPSAGKQILGHH